MLRVISAAIILSANPIIAIPNKAVETQTVASVYQAGKPYAASYLKGSSVLVHLYQFDEHLAKNNGSTGKNRVRNIAIEINVENTSERHFDVGSANIDLYANKGGSFVPLKVYSASSWEKMLEKNTKNTKTAEAIAELSVLAFVAAVDGEDGFNQHLKSMAKRDSVKREMERRYTEKVEKIKRDYDAKILRRTTIFPKQSIYGYVYADHTSTNAILLKVELGNDTHEILFTTNGKPLISTKPNTRTTRETRETRNRNTSGIQPQVSKYAPTLNSKEISDSNAVALLKNLSGKVAMHSSIKFSDLDSTIISHLRTVFNQNTDTSFSFRWSKSMAPTGHPRHGSYTLLIKSADGASSVKRILPNGAEVD